MSIYNAAPELEVMANNQLGERGIEPKGTEEARPIPHGLLPRSSSHQTP
jgi:hypothetical protein